MRFAVFLFFIPTVALANFSDVSEGHRSSQAISYVEQEGIVHGYPDGTFKPDQTINRAEFTKIIIGATVLPDAIQSCTTSDLQFPDVESDAWYSPFICAAKFFEVIEGYPDGTFGPGKNINYAEGMKIVYEAHFDTIAPREADVWWKPYETSLRELGALPDSYTDPAALITRSEMAEMIWRLSEEYQLSRSDDSSSSSSVVADCMANEQRAIAGVDMDRVRETWLGWLNDARASQGLPAYTYNHHLHRTAATWSNFSADRLEMSHKRIGQTEYYDYPMITQWFADLGLEFENIYRVTYSENIGRGPFTCSEDDCTDELIDAIRDTFDFYMAEEDDEYQPHYTSVMNNYFTEIGLGIAIGTDSNYYLTTHYGTKIISDPPGVCSF